MKNKDNGDSPSHILTRVLLCDCFISVFNHYYDLFVVVVITIAPRNECFRGYTGISLSFCSSVCPSVRRVSIRVQNTCVCQSAGKGINSLPYMATLGSSNITANKDVMDK